MKGVSEGVVEEDDSLKLFQILASISYRRVNSSRLEELEEELEKCYAEKQNQSSFFKQKRSRPANTLRGYLDILPANTLRGYLDILGLSSYTQDTISEKDLKQQYYAQAKKCHPDKGGTNEQFKKLGEAYNFFLILIDARRMVY